MEQSKTTDASGGVPAGWRLVPVEPTEDMIDVLRGKDEWPSAALLKYQVLLASAPPAPTPEAGENEDSRLAYALEQRDYWCCQVRHLQGDGAEPTDDHANEPNGYIRSLLTYADIAVRYGLHVEAYGMRDAAKRLREVEDRLTRYQTSELHVDADGPWSNDLKWNQKLVAWLRWFADKQLSEERDYGARNRLRWAAEALAGEPMPAPTPEAGSDLAKLSAAATQGEAHAAMDSFKLRVGPPGSTFENSFTTVAVCSTCEQAHANLTYLAALWNAHRTGRLVEASPSPPPAEDLAGQGERAVVRGELSQPERDALRWLLDAYEEGPCCTPGAVYSEHVTPTRITMKVDLPPTMPLSPEVAATESRVLEGAMQQAVRVLLIQSGYTGLPLPVSLVPQHPADDEASRLIRKSAELVRTRPPSFEKLQQHNARKLRSNRSEA